MDYSKSTEKAGDTGTRPDIILVCAVLESSAFRFPSLPQRERVAGDSGGWLLGAQQWEILEENESNSYTINLLHSPIIW